MRVFYLYDVKDSFYSMYKDYPYRLYKMFEDIYHTSKYNRVLSNSIYEKLTNKYNIAFMNNFIKNKNRLNIHYNNSNNTHILTYNFDYSKLFVGRYYIKIRSNLNYTSFFEVMNNHSDNIFVCDFENNDYFWLYKISNLKAKMDDNLIKE